MKKPNDFDLWLQTDPGKKCADYSTLRPGEYLKNRLYHAFAAGHLLDLANTERLNKTLEYYEKKVQSLKAELQEKDRQLRELQPQPLTNEPSASNA